MDKASLDPARDLAACPVHLAPGGAALVLPAIDGPQWYADYEAAHGGDGADGRLVTLHHFDADWDGWEMHPLGDEVVVCLAGAARLIQETMHGPRAMDLAPGQCALLPAGVWHTADVSTHASLLFITVGAGTQHRPRG